MNSKLIIAIVIALIGLIGGGAVYTVSLDFSTDNSSSDNSSTIINEGDTIINEAVGGFTDDIFDELIDRSYDYYCEEVEPDSEECDWYWDDYDD